VQSINFTGGVIHVINKVLTLPVSASQTLIDAGLSSAYGALNATSLLNAVDGLKNVTIFAPTNKAFQAIGSVLAGASTSALSDILKYHVVVGDSPAYSSTLTNGTSVKTLGGTNLNVYIVNGSVFVNNAKVVTADVLIA
jgi:uncharacterized surface protein with fasciclin (FAS1) repeats